LDQPEHSCRNMVNTSLKDGYVWEELSVELLEHPNSGAD
jgi:hypothetical protein